MVNFLVSYTKSFKIRGDIALPNSRFLALEVPVHIEKHVQAVKQDKPVCRMVLSYTRSPPTRTSASGPWGTMETQLSAFTMEQWEAKIFGENNCKY